MIAWKITKHYATLKTLNEIMQAIEAIEEFMRDITPAERATIQIGQADFFQQAKDTIKTYC